MIRRLTVAALCLAAVAGLTGCYSTPQSGEIGVVRNGKAWYMPFDWFDNRNIRGTVPNGAGNTWTGMGSDVHYYPVDSQQRFFRLQSCAGEPCEGADSTAITVPTADGVEVTISGTFYLNTSFNDSPDGERILRKFDQQFATRTFSGTHAYDGNKGWSHFLAAIVEPVIQNNMRQTVAGVTCAELVSSCALVQNQGNAGFTKAKELASGKVNKNNVQRIQDDINSNLQTDIRSTLGDDYFKNIKFNLAKVDLPPKVQVAIDQAQAAFADVSQAQAQVQRADLEAQANEKRQQGYLKCPTCARIDALKALPPNLQALGGNVALGIK
jgi:hypothetical protein